MQLPIILHLTNCTNEQIHETITRYQGHRIWSVWRFQKTTAEKRTALFDKKVEASSLLDILTQKNNRNMTLGIIQTVC